ncbi:kinesin family member 2/24 [Nematocida sp. AWRm80]|nr:kinesin family member 2/24 [Nematocida sp. AWRm80]
MKEALQVTGDNESIRRILKECGVEEWKDLLESNGIMMVGELRQVKYADLVQYGITEFEPRKKIFELIKRLNKEAERTTSQMPSRQTSSPRVSYNFSFIDSVHSTRPQDGQRETYAEHNPDMPYTENSTVLHSLAHSAINRALASNRLSYKAKDQEGTRTHHTQASAVYPTTPAHHTDYKQSPRNDMHLPYRHSNEYQSQEHYEQRPMHNPIEESSATDANRHINRAQTADSYTNGMNARQMTIQQLQKANESILESEYDLKALVDREDQLQKQTVLKTGFDTHTQWKRKKDMVSEIMEEAENSILDDDPEQDSHRINSGEDSSLFSHNWSNKSTDETEPFPGTERQGRITVVVRKRPIKKGAKRDAVAMSGSKVVLTEAKLRIDLTPYMEPHTYTFDMAFGETSTTRDLYVSCVRDLVHHALTAGSSTCLAYGQTGSGKTYTMLEENTGIITLAIKDLLIDPVTVSFCEIYGNNLYDLLDERKRIFAREKDGIVSIVGIKEHTVTKIDQALSLIRTGLVSRMTGRTGANTNSSRSHALFRVKTPQGMFTFVDLAGSERGSERAAEAEQTLLKREGAEINKSLLALKECIRAMDRSATHLPFRHSKLTQVLKESLIGESKCCIIATISPEDTSTEHSLNTLRYAHRIREIGVRNTPQNKDTDTSQAPSTNKSNVHTAVSIQETQPQPPGRKTSALNGPRRSIEIVSETTKQSVQQALAAAAARIARETNPETLESFRTILLDLANHTGRKT